jgi:hypothetical protein
MKKMRPFSILGLTGIAILAAGACVDGYESEESIGSIQQAIPGVGPACAWATRQIFSGDVMAQIENSEFRESLICARPPLVGQGDPPLRSSTVNTVECRYYCDRCRTPNTAAMVASIVTQMTAFGNAVGGNQGNWVMRQLATYVPMGMTALCRLIEGPRPATGSNCLSPEGLRDVIANGWGGAAGGVAACGAAVLPLYEEIMRQVNNSNDYGYLSTGSLEAISRIACKLGNALNTCASQPPPVGTAFAAIKAAFGNPYAQWGLLACDLVMDCTDEAVCEAAKTACKFTDLVASQPAPGFTPATGYASDGFCCCSQAGPNNNFGGPWSIIEEHRCIDSGWSFRPGTCGARLSNPPTPQELAERQAMFVPTTPAECAAFQAGQFPNPWNVACDGQRFFQGAAPQPFDAVQCCPFGHHLEGGTLFGDFLYSATCVENPPWQPGGGGFGSGTGGNSGGFGSYGGYGP